MNLTIKIESWPIRGHFTISRSSLTDVKVVTVEIFNGTAIGRGECRPYARYNETPEIVAAQIEAQRATIESGLSAEKLQRLMPAGAARNALDCALWDLRCKVEKTSIWDLIGTARPSPHPTAFTLSVDTPDAMARAAKKALNFKILKLKVDRKRVARQLQAVAEARPDCRFIVDANEALLSPDVYALAQHKAHTQIAMIEQPIHDKLINEHSFHDYNGPPLCADESIHNVDDLPRLKALGYKAVNIKLDKCGGFSGALKLIKAAKEQGFLLMGGCMLSTSLAVAPMAALMDNFDVIDLDGGALLEKDRKEGLIYENGKVHPPSPQLWG